MTAIGGSAVIVDFLPLGQGISPDTAVPWADRHDQRADVARAQQVAKAGRNCQPPLHIDGDRVETAKHIRLYSPTGSALS